jgi:hypothetical protein
LPFSALKKYATAVSTFRAPMYAAVDHDWIDMGEFYGVALPGETRGGLDGLLPTGNIKKRRWHAFGRIIFFCHQRYLTSNEMAVRAQRPRRHHCGPHATNRTTTAWCQRQPFYVEAFR